MPTVKEILLQTGISEDDISKMDAKLMQGFESVLATSSSAQAAAEAAQAAAAEEKRQLKYMFDNEINPGLLSWGSEKSVYDARLQYMEKLLEGAKANGFIAGEFPAGIKTTVQADTARGSDGKYVAGGNPVPGSPGFDPGQIITAVSNANWLSSEHLRLYGTPMPDDFESLLKESTAQRMSIKDYADRKYKFSEKRQEMTVLAQKKHDDGIVKETEDRLRKEYAERFSSNPNIRQGGPSQFDAIRKGVSKGDRKDPLTMSKEERHEYTRQQIAEDMANRESQPVT
jgi:hypothetical protein